MQQIVTSGAATAELMLIWRIDERVHAVQLAGVAEVTWAAAVSPPAAAAAHVLGYLDLRGEAVPVVDTRGMLGLAARPIQPSDRFVIMNRAAGRVALVVDSVLGVESVVLEDRSVQGGPGPELRLGRLEHPRAAEPEGGFNIAGGLIAVLEPDDLLRVVAGRPGAPGH